MGKVEFLARSGSLSALNLMKYQSYESDEEAMKTLLILWKQPIGHRELKKSSVFLQPEGATRKPRPQAGWDNGEGSMAHRGAARLPQSNC